MGVACMSVDLNITLGFYLKPLDRCCMEVSGPEHYSTGGEPNECYAGVLSGASFDGCCREVTGPEHYSTGGSPMHVTLKGKKWHGDRKCGLPSFTVMDGNKNGQDCMSSCELTTWPLCQGGVKHSGLERIKVKLPFPATPESEVTFSSNARVWSCLFQQCQSNIAFSSKAREWSYLFQQSQRVKLPFPATPECEVTVSSNAREWSYLFQQRQCEVTFSSNARGMPL